ncbi:TPA: helix-turn-helix transcriptional regulator [Burkholderia territorii]|uniref:helix-turn-helix domain-containing protein n=1 Tax=Burkholderia territorii TaxID=1503055 RepID=UPI0011C71E04|nr:helix-turn-helix transcriptional regulator [Burkholderia territorii]TXG05772.1 helix-turn-helix transcriptional regulator [Burkholderia territorii]HDR8858147.1 helix-turn-helix transcriptional regulator [Burkholderia territorii]HDR8864803.1 helix-turn-helix transcriptional regulator [Burkholderia territorii]HDR8870121.1 helix-turn-helix transcriptional regulator [Burkholderia territorii]HDR8874448.1 helix-turn-helix transcriptional regulator [Burkholderia territorii]
MSRTRLVPPPQSLPAREVLAINLRRMRAERGWTQEDLAEHSGLDRSFIAHVERQVRNISLDNMERLARALDVPISKLFEL